MSNLTKEQNVFDCVFSEIFKQYDLSDPGCFIYDYAILRYNRNLSDLRNKYSYEKYQEIISNDLSDYAKLCILESINLK